MSYFIQEAHLMDTYRDLESERADCNKLISETSDLHDRKLSELNYMLEQIEQNNSKIKQIKLKMDKIQSATQNVSKIQKEVEEKLIQPFKSINPNFKGDLCAFVEDSLANSMGLKLEDLIMIEQ